MCALITGSGAGAARTGKQIVTGIPVSDLDDLAVLADLRHVAG